MYLHGPMFLTCAERPPCPHTINVEGTKYGLQTLRTPFYCGGNFMKKINLNPF